MSNTLKDNSQDRRAQILDAAIVCFAKQGFHLTSMHDISAQAGISVGLIYRYFENKEALVNALYQKHKGALTALVLKDFPVDKPARQMVHVLWTRLADYAREQPRAFAFLELHHHADYLDAQSQAVETRIVDLACRFLQAAQARGEVKPYPPMLLIAVLHGAFVGMLRKAWEGLLELTPETSAQAEQCAWEAIRA